MPERDNIRSLKLLRKTSEIKSKMMFKRKVLKMLAVMEQPHQRAAGESAAAAAGAACNVDEFLNTGRTGRRNALPDILSDHALVTTADLPARLQTLKASDEPSTSGTSSQEPGTSQQHGNSSNNNGS